MIKQIRKLDLAGDENEPDSDEGLYKNERAKITRNLER